MKHNSIPAIFLVLMLSLGLVGCQSTSSVEDIAESVAEPAIAETVQAEDADEAEVYVEPVAEPEPAEEVVETEAGDIAEEVPVTVSYSYQGYTVEVVSYDGYAEVSYPSIVTASDIDAFMASEVAKYGNQVAGVYYKANDGILELIYPEGLSAEVRNDALYMFCEDISATIIDIFSLDASTFTPVIR